VDRYTTRLATVDDTEFLWKMLYYASHSDEDGVTDAEALKSRPELSRYVAGWGRDSDIGVVVAERASGRAVGAAWFRLLTGDERGYGYIDDSTPELAIATEPEHRGAGAGTLLLEHLLPLVLARHVTVCLSCRLQNPARKLYERMGFVLVPGSARPNRVGGTSGIMTLRRPA
jgi:GNAT superfamily N-acetyltransferase